MATPTPKQAAALALLAKGDVHRWERGDTWRIVAHDGTVIPKVVVNSLLKKNWARYGDLNGIRRPLALTDEGRALATSSTPEEEGS